MQIIIQGHKVKVTAPMKDYAQKKISKLTHYFENIQKIEVTMDARTNADVTRTHVAEVTLWAAGKKVIRATEASGDMYSAIDMVFDEVVSQLRKHKEKRVKEVRRKAHADKEEIKASLPARVGPRGAAIVAVNRFADKPMTEDEAKDEVIVFKKDFLLFLNPDTGNINLAYKKGKSISVMEPEEAALKDCTPDEAAREISGNDSNFIMFKNKETKSINVIYKRRSGDFGLIEPRL